MDLFEQRSQDILSTTAPLADRMRPRTLDEFFGQSHIVGPGRLLRRAIQIDQLSSLIFYGPPGTGKTTLARIIAHTTKAQFLSINAVLAGVQDIRDAIDSAKKTLSLYGKRTILFIDEVHRFNKAQQDALLPHVENGVLILIGATTENPYFEVNKALVSRSRIFQLKTLTASDLAAIAHAALGDKERGYGGRKVSIDKDALDHIVAVANGDARGVLNALELAVETTKPDKSGAIRIIREVAEDSIQQKAVLYDKDGDAHYDTISAFIKSLRGSDPDAALYWMAKMVYAGEDPRFIFRRMLILACEDIGLADPRALSVVVDAARAFDYVGLPEGRFHLAHACLYLATAPKSNSSMAFFDALSTVSHETKDDVPAHLQDSSRDKEGFGHGEGYLYPHAFRDHWVAQQYLPSSLQGKFFYQPSDIGYEKEIGLRVTRLREAMVEAMAIDDEDIFEGDAQDTPGPRRLWVKRTRGGDTLSAAREKIFEAAAPGRDSLVLDLHARTGLLTFEALRLSPEGSVWALAHDEKEFDTVVKMAAQYELLKRPTVLLTSMDKFDADIKKSAGQNVAFDAIIGRNIIAAERDKPALVKRMLALLAKDGCIALAETVHSQGQRLSSLLTFRNLPQNAISRFAKAEERLFADKGDALVNWDPASLEKQCAAQFPCVFTVQTIAPAGRRRITPGMVDHWFRPRTEGGRTPLGARLEEEFGKKAAAEIKKQIHGQLDNTDIPWKTSIAIMRIFAARA
ncbi:MAG TPA: AAA family ATPase [Chitinivibrionales bacterium]|nr:AAA family ATPase [Chitinivibrionales bacterium]